MTTTLYPYLYTLNYTSVDDKQPIRSQRCDAIEEMAEVKYYIVRETLGSTLVIATCNE